MRCESTFWLTVDKFVSLNAPNKAEQILLAIHETVEKVGLNLDTLISVIVLE